MNEWYPCLFTDIIFCMENAINTQYVLDSRQVKPGDIYKLDVHNLHAVKNGNETRYHILFQGGRY